VVRLALRDAAGRSATSATFIRNRPFRMNWVLFKNSLLVSGGAMALAVGIGVVVALALACLSRGWRNVALGLCVAALALPPFVVVGCWIDLLGQTGKWRDWLPVEIYSLSGTVWVLALMFWPVTTILVCGSMARLDREMIESDPALGGGRLIRHLLLPFLRPALSLAAVMTFVLALNQFAVPAILQTKVYSAEVWLRFNTAFDHWGALQASWPLVLAPLALLWCRRGQVWSWPSRSTSETSRALRRQLGDAWCGGLAVAGALVLMLSLALPLWQLTSEARTWRELGGALAAGREALWNSFFFAAVTATLVCALGVLSRRWPIGGLLWAPFLLPGVLLGIGLILLLNRPKTAWFYQSAGVVLLALAMRYLAIGRSGAARAFAGVDQDLTETARLAGAGGWRLFREVHWPQVAGPLLAAWYAVYLLCLWDVESVVLVVPPGGETLALRIFNLLHYGHNAQVNALCVALMGLAVAPLALAGVWRTTFTSGGNSKSQVPSSKGIPNSKLQTLQARCSGWAVGIWGFLGYCSLGFGIFLLTGCSPVERADGVALASQLFSRVEIIGSRGAGAGQFNKPRSLALDREDNLYVVDMTARVQKFSPDGRYLGAYQFELTDLGRPKGMGRDAEGNIVVVEPHYKRVNHLSPDLRLVKQWGAPGTDTGQLAFPRSAAVNARGEIYVSEYMYVERVQRFEKPGGELLGVFGEAGQGDGQFNRPEGLGVDSQGRVYVADSCNHRVQVFTRDGNFLRTYGQAGSAPGELSYPYDVQIDATGLQFVCEFGNSRVQVFDANDRPVEILGGKGGGVRLATPWAVALDSKGNLYVADAGNHRVVKFVRRENPKPQAPTSKKTPSAKFQGASRARQNLELGVWSFLGTWNLELGTWNRLEVFQ